MAGGIAAGGIAAGGIGPQIVTYIGPRSVKIDRWSILAGAESLLVQAIAVLKLTGSQF